jgi:hypothetical protein
MRKVLVTILLIISLAGGIALSTPLKASANETLAFEYDKFTYEKVLIDGVIWIFVYNDSGSLMEIYPETITTGPAHGGH